MPLRSALSKLLMIVVFGALAGGNMQAQSVPGLNLMPWPASVQPGSGALKIDAAFAVAFTGYKEARLDSAGRRFLSRLQKQTGLLISSQPGDPAKAKLIVHTDHASKGIQELGEDESYTLEVTSNGAQLSAANPLGALRGLQTF